MNDAETQRWHETMRDAEAEFWKVREGNNRARHRQHVMRQVMATLRPAGEKANDDHWDYLSKLEEAEMVFEEIANALCAHTKDMGENGKFWYPLRDHYFLNRPEEWTEASPVDGGALDAATAKYLNRPWMQVNLIDWYILNGLIEDEVLRLCDSMRSGEAYGRIDIAYAMSEGKYTKWVLLRIAFAAAKFILKWVLLPAAAALAFFFGHETVGTWIAGAFGAIVFLRLLFLPRTIIQWRARMSRAKTLQHKLDTLLQVSRQISATTLNPTRLRDFIRQEEEGGLLVRSAVHSVLDRAIARDPAVFTAERG